jgi:hypothetical protein
MDEAIRLPTRGANMPDDPNSDPFKPPEIPTLVGCLHCGEEYDSYLIEWRILKTTDGRMRGFWCCPTVGCDGLGFGCDIFPVDPDFRDERGGWCNDDDDHDEEFDSELENDALGPDSAPGARPAIDENIPWDDEDNDIPF